MREACRREFAPSRSYQLSKLIRPFLGSWIILSCICLNWTLFSSIVTWSTFAYFVDTPSAWKTFLWIMECSICAFGCIAICTMLSSGLGIFLPKIRPTIVRIIIRLISFVGFCLLFPFLVREYLIILPSDLLEIEAAWWEGWIMIPGAYISIILLCMNCFYEA